MNKFYIINLEKIEYETEDFLINNEQWIKYKCKYGSFNVHPQMDISVIEKGFKDLVAHNPMIKRI